MIRQSTLGIFIMLLSFFSYAQDNSLVALAITEELKENANAVVRKNDITIELLSYNKMLVKQHRVVTVFNKKGSRSINAGMSYDNTIAIKVLEAKVYDALGTEIKKIKKKDFIDVSLTDDVSIYSDDRAKYLRYIPNTYPYTVEYTEESIHTSTAFIPKWYPIGDYNTSIEQSSILINNSSGITLSKKEYNVNDFNITRVSDFNYSASNIKAIQRESKSPSFSSIMPSVRFSLKEFDIKGVKGVNTSWKDFGKWMNDKLISETTALPEAVKVKMRALTKNASTDLEKARIIYDYMQNKTRYISVQIGVGGWKPMLASDVDRLGYGDCKALTNYTKSLLEAVGVTSYYTVIDAGSDIKDIDKTFSSFQGNHVILSVPNENDYTFLECTSQTTPFGYTANFTDDRDALVIKPEGGEIVHTKVYNTKDNLQDTKAKVKLDKLGNIKAEISIVSGGTQYSYHEGIQNESEKDKESYYKNYLDNINNLELLDIKFNNDKKNIKFTEEVALSARKYATKSGNLLLISPNMFNKIQTSPPRYENRQLPFEVDRGFFDSDETEIVLDEGITVEALKEPVSIKNKFGEYQCSIKKVSDNKLIYSRKLIINKGKYSKDEYKEYRAFYLNIVKHDKSKIALKTI